MGCMVKGEDGREVERSRVIEHLDRFVTYNVFDIEKEGVSKVTHRFIHLHGTL